MTLFEHLNPAFFRPLAATGAPVYADVLLALFATAVQRHQAFPRHVALEMARNRLAQADALAETTDLPLEADLTAETQAESDTLSIRAHGLLRYFEQCGWLRPDTQSDYTQVYALTEPAYHFLSALHQWLTQSAPPLAGLLSAIHDTLKAAAQEGDLATRIPQAHSQTEQLLVGLQSLHHNMGEHLNVLLKQPDVRAILEHWFTHYRNAVIVPAYHALRTTAHEGRYRQGALEALQHLLNNPNKLHEAAHDMVNRRQAATTEDGYSRLYEQIRTIQKNLSDLDDRLHALDERHELYISAASRAVRLRLAAHTTLSGQLDALVRTAANHPSFAETAANRLNCFALRLPEAGSLAPPRRQPTPFVPSPTTLADPDPAEVQAARQATRRELQRAFSPTKVRDRVRTWLADHPRRAATDLPLATPADLPWLIYVRAYGTAKMGYHIEETDECVHVGGFQFRQFFVVKDDP